MAIIQGDSEIPEEGRKILSELGCEGNFVGQIHRKVKLEEERADELLR